MSADSADQNFGPVYIVYHDAKYELNPSFNLEVMRS